MTECTKHLGLTHCTTLHPIPDNSQQSLVSFNTEHNLFPTLKAHCGVFLQKNKSDVYILCYSPKHTEFILEV